MRLYRALGGEIVTLGSDAHSPAQAGQGLREGAKLLRCCGFDRVAVYRRRQPDYIDITTEG